MNIIDIVKEDNSKCCGCGNCENICPQKAIKLKKDKYGFKYPSLVKDCTNCGLCQKVCPLNSNLKFNTPQKVYCAAQNSDEIYNSASGGMFYAFGKKFIENGGIVYGSALLNKEDQIVIEHIKATDLETLKLLRGSKYVQSNLNDIFLDIRKELKSNKKVLFSGTPCQVAALKKFLISDYENLYTIDIICHGVPNQAFFKDYLKTLESKEKAKVVDFKFRNKKAGWGYQGLITYIDDKDKKFEKDIYVPLSSYYKSFFNCDTYRESCFSCKFARKERISDITLGDYWGIENEEPELLKKNGGNFDEIKGISCTLVNSEKGKEMIELVKDDVSLAETEFEKVQRHNHQLETPTKKGINRDTILNLYSNNGYDSVETWFNKKIKIKKYVYLAFNKLPNKLKKVIKRHIA